MFSYLQAVSGTPEVTDIILIMVITTIIMAIHTIPMVTGTAIHMLILTDMGIIAILFGIMATVILLEGISVGVTVVGVIMVEAIADDELTAGRWEKL